MISGRDVIIYFSLKYQGDWERIYQAMKTREDFALESVQEMIGSLRCGVVTIIDEDYPDILKKIYKPPFVLYYYGDLHLIADVSRCVAVVGSRQATPYGEHATARVVDDLAKAGYVVISGMAKGIDASAHWHAITVHGKTAAVLGSGIDHCYPKENLDLYQTLKKEHLVLSEYPGDVGPNAEHFPWRNRIIAGLAQGLVVTEARKRSGTLITVGYALYMGRDVFVIPHPIDSDNSCNQLIKDGATLIENGQDVVDGLKSAVTAPPADDPSKS